MQKQVAEFHKMLCRGGTVLRAGCQRCAPPLACALVLLLTVFAGEAFAATGDQIFKTATCNLLDDVITKDFGAMITVLAGSLAILASVMGSFKGAWVLLFVSVGCYVLPETVDVLFPGMC